MTSLQPLNWKTVNEFLLTSNQIPSFLSPEELCTLSRVSKIHQEICGQSKFWIHTVKILPSTHSFLSNKELCVLSRVSKTHNKICNQSLYWKQIKTKTSFKHHSIQYSEEQCLLSCVSKENHDFSNQMQCWRKTKVEKSLSDISLKAKYLQHKSFNYRITEAFEKELTPNLDYIKSNRKFQISLLATTIIFFHIISLISFTEFLKTLSKISPENDQNIVRHFSKNNTLAFIFSIQRGVSRTIPIIVGSLGLITVGAGIYKSSKIAIAILLRIAKKRMLENKVLTLIEITAGTGMVTFTGVNAIPAIAISTTAVGIAKIADKSIITKRGSRALLTVVKKTATLISSIFKCCVRR